MSVSEELEGQTPELIVLGGSAGSIDVLRAIMLELTPRFAPALAVVIHMAQDARPVLHQILSGVGRPPVKLAEDKEPVVPGTVYFASPGYHLLVEAERTFALSLDEPEHFSRPSIDVLFESAAEAYGARAAGILLSGANSDGAAGLRAIADAGGLAIVQQPDTAEVPVMPESALLACPASRVLDVAEIARWLGSRVREPQRG